MASGSLWLVVALVTAMCKLLQLLRSKIHLFFFADCWYCQLVSVFRQFLGRGILYVRRLKILHSMEQAISNNELREAVDFSRRRRRRSVVEWQYSINWSLIALSSEYLSKTQCSPSRRSRVTYWAIDSFGAWWAWRKVCHLNWKLFWGGKCVFSAVSASV